MKELNLDVCHLPSAAAEQHAKTEFVMLCVQSYQSHQKQHLQLGGSRIQSDFLICSCVNAPPANPCLP